MAVTIQDIREWINDELPKQILKSDPKANPGGVVMAKSLALGLLNQFVLANETNADTALEHVFKALERYGAPADIKNGLANIVIAESKNDACVKFAKSKLTVAEQKGASQKATQAETKTADKKDDSQQEANKPPQYRY